ncbi:hypothetical protein AAFF_G00011650 [Aldrovandia affinis]|uniref:Uncharacterized protein n=1 Tax=Aldrovandia affinis TaxID=143900 RepID=A0AAD7R397_9TELE|nr:hypothetical protein AAFF_G00011650 [Aldrovandia affinis]
MERRKQLRRLVERKGMATGSTGSPLSTMRNYNRVLPPAGFGGRWCDNCETLMDSTQWALVEPSTFTENGIFSYRFTCCPGHYECSESGLRWVCEAEVTLQYRYGSWEDHKSLQHSLHFTEGGPLLDITVTADPDFWLWNEVKVFHVKESGATLESVSEVTRFHVRILRPTFSPMGVVLKKITGLKQRVGEFLLRVHSYLLLFHCPKNAYLTLHVYHVPKNQALIKAVEEKEKEAGSVRIYKPHEPKTSLKLKSSYNLRASCTPDINPESLELNGNPNPNFFEVYVKPAEVMKHAESEIVIELIYEKETICVAYMANCPRRDEGSINDLILGVLDNLSAENLDKFKHKLSKLHKIGYGLIEKETNIAITGRIIDNFGKKNAIARTAEVLRAIGVKDEANDLEEAYAGQGGASTAGTGGGTEGQHFVEKHQLELIERVKMVESILDQLLHQKRIDGPRVLKIRWPSAARQCRSRARYLTSLTSSRTNAAIQVSTDPSHESTAREAPQESNKAITERIINRFGEKNAIAPIAVVLSAIGLKDGADNLEEAYAGQGGASAAGTGGTGGSASGSGSTQMLKRWQFVLKNQLDLNERVKMVESILVQLLHQELIDYEEYESVMAETTPRGQMRKLLHDVIYPGGRELMDELYRILEENEPALMRDLKCKYVVEVREEQARLGLEEERARLGLEEERARQRLEEERARLGQGALKEAPRVPAPHRPRMLKEELWGSVETEGMATGSTGSPLSTMRNYNRVLPPAGFGGRRCDNCEAWMDSTQWALVEPSTFTENGIFSYRFTCCPGHYKCSESGLRWVCEAEVTLQYRYGSWEDHKSLQHSLHFTEGKILDITVTAGQLKEIHLPHFICLGPDSSLRNEVKVIHVKESGASLESVSEVTRFHVRILRPTFSPMGVVLENTTDLKQRIHSYLLLFRCPKNAYLTLHVYLIPNSQPHIKAVEEIEKKEGSVRICKPHEPKTSLMLTSEYNLRASCTAVISGSLELRNGNLTPNFFEVYVKPAEVLKHAETEIVIELIYEKETMWETRIRRGDYSSIFLEYFFHFSMILQYIIRYISNIHTALWPMVANSPRRAEGSINYLILDVLENLSAENLDKFKHKLSELHKIGYGLIEKESNAAITGRIIEKFTKKNAIACTAEVLRAIGVKDGADNLEEAYAGQGGASAAGTGGGASAAGTGGEMLLLRWGIR